MRSKVESVDHVRLIESVMRGPPDTQGIDNDVRHSWTRCLSTYSLDPRQVKKPIIVERSDLMARRERLGAMLPIANFEMLGLCKQIPHWQFGVMLTDAEGVILSYVGDSGFSDMARRSGFREGANWSERELGTNGMGTCLMTQRPVVIHRDEHFLMQNTGLTCSAAPIFDPQGQVLAVLDISGATECRTHTLALVDIAARNIENRMLLDACKRHFLLRFHRCAEFITTTGEGVIAFDERGTIVGANRSALQLLECRDHKALCGRSIDALFDVSPATLVQQAMRPGFVPELLALKLDQGLRAAGMYAAVQAPVTERRRMPPRAIQQIPPQDRLTAMESGDSAQAQNVRVARRVLDRNISILLLGETGTGKGYFARAMHGASQRADKPFVAVNCAAIPELLIESELFGYKPGAFTGATREGHAGRILQANGGTLFLDEIGDMPLSLQARLLTVIEDREVTPLGGSRPVPVDIHIISATHGEPVEMIAKGQFRQDLYYRLNGITMTMPPLRKRQDAAAMVRSLLRLEAGDQQPLLIDDALVERLARYSWPGNLRQLRNVLRTMLALCDSDRLRLDDFDERWLQGGASTQPAPQTDTQPAAAGGDDLLGSAERDALLRMLETCRWNVSVAANRLHLSRKTMYRKMHRHGLARRDHVEGSTSGYAPRQGEG